MNIVDQLRAQAARSAEATQFMARAKSERNQAAGDVGATYQGGTPEMMLEWKAADEIERLRYLLSQYVADETRFNRGDGEPYGSISTDVGIEARQAVLALARRR